MGIYSNLSVSNPRPLSKLTEVAVPLLLTAVGPVASALPVPFSPDPGVLYWLVVVGSDTSPPGGLMAAVATISPQQTDPVLGYAADFSTPQCGYFVNTGVYFLPAIFPAGGLFLTPTITPAEWMFFNT